MSKKDDDLFYLCSLIEYISRKTNNTKKYIVEKIGKKELEKIYSLAGVYHCENIDKVTDEIVSKCGIEMGDYVNTHKARIPSYFEIGSVYERLIREISGSNSNYIDSLIEVLSSWIVKKIDNYDSSMYYENPSYILECYKEGKIL